MGFFDNMIIDYCCAKECCNPDNLMRYICCKCGMCGRKFDGQMMIDDGGTSPIEWDECDD